MDIGKKRKERKKVASEKTRKRREIIRANAKTDRAKERLTHKSRRKQEPVRKGFILDKEICEANLNALKEAEKEMDEYAAKQEEERQRRIALGQEEWEKEFESRLEKIKLND